MCTASLTVYARILLQRVLYCRAPAAGTEGRTDRRERNEMTFWLRCQQIVFAVSKCLLRISHQTFEVRQRRGILSQLQPSGIDPSLDYTSHAATVHSETSVINYGAGQQMKTASPGPICNVPNGWIQCTVYKVNVKVNDIQSKELGYYWSCVNTVFQLKGIIQNVDICLLLVY